MLGLTLHRLLLTQSVCLFVVVEVPGGQKLLHHLPNGAPVLGLGDQLQVRRGWEDLHVELVEATYHCVSILSALDWRLVVHLLDQTLPHDVVESHLLVDLLLVVGWSTDT